jgi:hypothetical protein
MARSSARRQKQLERKRLKRKEKRHTLARRQPSGLSGQIARAASAPVVHCAFCGALSETEGMVQVLVSREFEPGVVAVGIFLVDTWCLGVKDAFARITTRSDYEDNIVVPLSERFPFRHATPACARKFVEGAVAFARDLGFQPNPGYRKAAPIFGNADPDECPETFTFGFRGQPHFFAGPNDTAEKCQRVIQTLRNRLGEGNFYYTMPAFDDSLFAPEYSLLPDPAEEDDED